MTVSLSSSSANGSPEEVGSSLLALHGELMDSQALAALFKFRSGRAFRRSASKGALPVSVFRVPGRRGWFARTRDVGLWLTSASTSPVRRSPNLTSMPSSVHQTPPEKTP